MNQERVCPLAVTLAKEMIDFLKAVHNADSKDKRQVHVNWYCHLAAWLLICIITYTLGVMMMRVITRMVLMAACYSAIVRD